jgi:succinyl-diaminopimelate desuccinylase
MIRLKVVGRAAHGSTPWQGDNAVLKAVDTFRRIEGLPFARESSDLFDRPSINLGRIHGGDAVNKVPDEAIVDVDIRFLPGQEPGAILAEVRAMPDVEVIKTFIRPPAIVSRDNPYVQALKRGIARSVDGDVMSVGRDGASDAIAFLDAGIPAVEFGPRGGGHHGPEEWVSIASLRRYREALVDFVRTLPAALGQDDDGGLRAIEGGLA